MVVYKKQEEQFESPRETYRTRPTGRFEDVKDRGKRTKIHENEKAEENIRALSHENPVADILHSAGYKVNQNPKGQSESNPDYEIEGKMFDLYSPSSKNVRTIWDTLSKKAHKQADRIILNLADSNVSLEELKQYLKENEIKGLEEIKIIDKHGNIIEFFPFCD